MGAFSRNAALDGKQLIDGLAPRRAVTTPSDASIPNTKVHDAATARSMAHWIAATMSKATGGRDLEPGRPLPDRRRHRHRRRDEGRPSAPTGSPPSNPLRQVAFEASTGTTSLTTLGPRLQGGDLAVL